MILKKINILFVFVALMFVSAGFSEGGVVIIDQHGFDDDGFFDISESENWMFHKGNNTSWAHPDMNTSDWEYRRPIDLSLELENDQGVVEGWFRIKVKVDELFRDSTLYVNIGNYGQAIDMYIDGEFYHSYGSTGAFGKPYKRNEGTNLWYYRPINLEPGEEHLIALHYLHQPLGFPYNLITTDDVLFFTMSINESTFEQAQKESQRKMYTGLISTATASLVLLLLFIMLYYLNRRESILKYIIFAASLSTFITFFMIPNSNVINISIQFYTLIRPLFNLALAGLLFSIAAIFAKVFAGKSIRSIWYLAIPALIMFANMQFTRIDVLNAVVLLFYIGTGCYYIIKSWKKLKGAQWAIIAGFFVILFSIVTFFTIIIITGSPQTYITYYIAFITFPTSLMIYISLRFKEINEKIKINTEKLLKVTEEKRQQAVNQQAILEEQVKERTAELRQSLEDLMNTQSQLIHAEKMASLGELTAGIAHEIQNPLNFVNNFSEVSVDMIAEINEEIEKGNSEEIKVIAETLKQNLDKISFHGKRASSIVKGMLEHSRAGNGRKEPTDINALADEYLRLAYHGLRAKDKSFNADFKTDLDKHLPKVNVVGQDVARVMLNLINNAFHAVSSKALASEEGFYKPQVIVSTKKLDDKIEIRVKDNGNGIPENIKDKIFQPFFTTKPSGEGTGLGLSISYDIITKGHGGILNVISKQGEGTEFIIILPT
ncbi:MAG: HAMP domain-containing sensor histidine kinase [Bacteroidales bacterium]